MSYRILIEIWERRSQDEPTDTMWYGDVWTEGSKDIGFDRACHVGLDLFHGSSIVAQQGQLVRVDVTLQRVPGHDVRHWTRTRYLGGRS